MQRTLGNLLIVAGTVLGALAAAESKRANRVLDLGAAPTAGEYLARDVPGAGEVPLAAAGDELTPQLVVELKGAGEHDVSVRRPPIDHRRVALDEAEGEVLAEPVVLPGETQDLRHGRMLTADLLERAAAAGVETFAARTQSDEPRTVAAGDPPPDDLAHLVLAEDLTLPARLEAGTFLDAGVLARLREADVEAVEARVSAPFEWSEWGWKWLFVAAVLAMLGGVALKRAVPAGDAGAVQDSGAGPLGDWIAAAAADAAALAEQVDGLDAAALHERLDELLGGPVYELVEAREELKRRLGLSGFAEVMGPFASGERKLNRAWSAAVDAELPEARDCVRAAVPFFAEARDQLAAALTPR